MSDNGSKTHPYVLKMTGISKAFDASPVLKDVNFTLSKGEVVALMGENGAGKSTLMKILSGIYLQDDGIISIDSTDQKIRDVKDAMTLGIALIHQELNLVDNLDVASNIFLGREPLGRFGIVQKKKLYHQAKRILDILGVEIPVNASIDKLSIGELQMIEIAKAVSQNARILIMDEPTSSLTVKETKILFKVIEDLKSKGVSIVYISHRLSEVYEIADRAVVLKDGRNSGELMKGEINHDNILKLMVGRSLAPVIKNKLPGMIQWDFTALDLRTSKYPQKKINFKIARGEIVGIAGLMGAGRTELVNTIFGITQKVGGKIYLNGAEVHIERPADAIENGIFLVPEDRRKQGVIAEMDVVDNITITNLEAYSIMGLIQKRITKKVSEKQTLQLNLASAAQNPLVKYLSGGNQQKVAIAKWLALSPNLIIFDEPTRGVDVGAKSEIYNIMRMIANSNSMILIVSSDMEEVMKISDRILVMSDGEITGELLRSEFSEEKIIRLAVAK
jgi:ribose transport system ATP-binding protein